MSTVTTKDGARIFYKDWGPRPARSSSHHGWPLSSDDWDTQMLFFVQHGYRVIGIDRRGPRTFKPGVGRPRHGSLRVPMRPRSSSIWIFVIPFISAIPPAAVKRPATSHATARAGSRRLVLVAAVPPIMVMSPNNPGGLPIEVFDGFRKSLAANRAQFYRDVASKPFYGFKSAGRVAAGWRRRKLVAARHDGQRQGPLRRHQGIFGNRSHRGPQEHRGSNAVHAGGRQTRSFRTRAPRSCRSSSSRTPPLKLYPGFPHGMLTTYAETLTPGSPGVRSRLTRAISWDRGSELKRISGVNIPSHLMSIGREGTRPSDQPMVAPAQSRATLENRKRRQRKAAWFSSRAQASERPTCVIGSLVRTIPGGRDHTSRGCPPQSPLNAASAPPPGDRRIDRIVGSGLAE